MVITTQHVDLLQQGTKQLGVHLAERQQKQLLAYLTLLAKWNKAYNLTAIRNIDDMVARHLLDSLSIIPYIESDHWLDVGSGGGMPGIPLAIMFADSQFTLLDSNGKKTRFLTQVVLDLKLTNVTIINDRVEAVTTEKSFTGIVSRAFSSLHDFVSLTKHLADEKTQWFAMKGVYPVQELAELPVGFKIKSKYQLDVPYNDGQRHLLIIEHGQ